MRNEQIDVERAVGAGLAAGTAFLATTFLDSKLSNYPYNDIKLVGQVFTTKSPFWQIQGLVGHYGFSVVMALLYARYAYRLLPGPGWLKGLLFLMIENNGLYPLAPLLDRIHAGQRKGELPRLMALKSYVGQTWRHVAFGLVLGALYRNGSET
ncbi:MAG: hypothetical protein M3441_05250 [Chloroflexota bacterium]|nr:hypothetical protein [Chloroflexota bacterium]